MEEREGCRARGVSFFFFPSFPFPFSVHDMHILMSVFSHIGSRCEKPLDVGFPALVHSRLAPKMAQAHDFEFDFEDGLEVAYEEEDEDETEALEMGEHWDERFRRVISLEQQVSRKEEKETSAGIGKRVMETPLGHEARGQQRDDEVEMISPEGNGNLHVHIGPAS